MKKPTAQKVENLFQDLINKHDLSFEGEPLYPDCRVEDHQIIFEDEGMMYLLAGYVSSSIFDEMETMLAEKLGIEMIDSDGTIMTFEYI
jgi:hypothetical protein